MKTFAEFIKEDYNILVPSNIRKRFEDPDISPDELQKIADNGSNLEKIEVTQHEKVTPDVLKHIAYSSKHHDVNLQVAANPKTDPETLVYIKNKYPNSSYIKAAYASHQNADSGILDDLKHDKNPFVREHIIRNKNTSLDTIRSMANNVLNDRELEDLISKRLEHSNDGSVN